MSLLDYLVSNRPLQLHADLPPGMLLAAELKGCEEISQLYQFEIGLLTPRPLAMDFSQILGKEAAIELRPSNTVTRYFHGLINRFTEGRKDEHFTHYSASLVPKFWLWTQQIRNRVFQRMTVPEILNEVLNGLEVKPSLTATYQPREYCVQYQESDFAFASRLMEEEGIYYFFEHRVDAHTLVLTDSHFQLTDVPEPAIVRFDELAGGVLEELRVNRWQKSQQIRTSQFTLWDFNFQMPDDHLEAQQQLLEQVAVGTVTHTLKAVDQSLEHYEYPGGYARHFDGVSPAGADEAADLTKIFEENQRIVKVRMQEEAAGAIWIDGQSNCAQFLPGHHFNLLWHGMGDGKYLVKRVEHDAQLDLSYRSDDTSRDTKYENRFVCLPADLPFRPARVTARPKIEGMQTATVVGPTGDQVFIDKYGRIKIQFHWDRQGQLNASSSCWVRVAQVWAGNRWGAFFWPRLGQEVVVTFEEGNPDRPLIIGSVYNADNMPPFELPTNLNLCGIRSCTLAGTGTQTFNTFVFDDTSGDEHLSLHSENHVHISSELANYHFVPHNHMQMIGSLPFGSGSGGGFSAKRTAPITGSGMGGGKSRKRTRTHATDPTGFKPSWGQQPTLGLPPDSELLMQHVLGPDLVKKVASLRERPYAASGQGGGLWDFPAAVAAGGGGSHEFQEFFENQMPASFKIVSGDAVSVNFRDSVQRYWSGTGFVFSDLQDIVIGGILGHLGASPLVEGICGGLLGFGGLLNLGIGSTASMNYGPNLSVQRGESMTVHQHAFWHTTTTGMTDPQVASATLQSNAVRLLLIVITLGGIICDLLLRIKCVPSASAGTVQASELLLFLYNAIYSRLLGILIAIEKAFSHLQKAGDDAASAAKSLAQSGQLLARASKAAIATAKNRIAASERRTKAAIVQATKAAESATAALAGEAETAFAEMDAKLNEASSHARQISGNYGVTAAGDIEFRSAHATNATSITLRAEGAGGTPASAGISGALTLIGTNTASLSCGGGGGFSVTGTPAVLAEVSMDAGLEGEASICAGVPEEGPCITLNPEMGSFLNGPPDVGAAITLLPAELTIQCGIPGVGASIKLTPASLTLAIGENIWTLTPEGLTKEVMMQQSEIDVSAEEQMAMYSAMFDAVFDSEAAMVEQM